MAKTFNKEFAAKIRSVQEEIKSTAICEHCKERGCKGCLIGDMTEVYTLRAEIILDQEKLDFINELLSMTGDEIYDKYGLKRDETIVNTAVFPDGMQADIKLVICDEESYTEAVLFDKNGFQKAYTDPADEYTGDWELEYDDINYVVTVKAKEPVGYRSDGIFGDGYRNVVDVMIHEIFCLWNTDILYTLADSILKDTDIAEDMVHLANDLQSPRALYFADILEEENKFAAEDKAKTFVRKILDAVKEKTGKNIKYVLWLSDSVDDIISTYEPNDSVTEFDEYSTANGVVLSDLGKGGKFFGYEELPAAIRTVDREMNVIG